MPSTHSKIASHREDPPRHCPTCAVDLGAYPYYQRVPCTLSRWLNGLGRATILPMFGLALYFLLVRETPIFPSPSIGFILAGFTIGPAMLLYAFTRFLPRYFRVVCLRCSWYRDYAFRFRVFEAKESAASGSG